jgi:hypothetical protein
MKIRNITYTNSSCAYYAHHEWTIETTSNDEKEVLDYCRQYMAKKARSHEDFLYAKEKAYRKKMVAMMVIDGVGYYSFELFNYGKRDMWGFYKWRYFTHAENIY